MVTIFLLSENLLFLFITLIKTWKIQQENLKLCKAHLWELLSPARRQFFFGPSSGAASASLGRVQVAGVDGGTFVDCYPGKQTKTAILFILKLELTLVFNYRASFEK